MKLRLLIAGLIFISNCGLLQSAYPQTIFQKHFGWGSETGHKIIEADSGYIICGSYNYGGNTSDILVTKIDFSGNVVWTKTYGGIWSDDALSIEVTHDGGYILAGYTSSYGGLIPNDYDCALLFKIDSSGNLIWSQILELGGIDIACSVKETFDHGFIVTGYSSGSMFLAKTDSLGAVTWSVFLSNSNLYSGFDGTVIQKRDSSYAVLGMLAIPATSDTAAALYIVGPTGMGIYAHYYQVMYSSVSDDITYAYDLHQNQEGDLLIAGGSGGNFQNLFYAYAPFVMKTDSAGNYLGGKIYSLNTGPGKAYSVKERTGGGYIIGGTMGSFYPLLIETDTSLNTNWCYYYGSFSPPGNNAGFGFDAIPLSGGGYTFIGYRTYTNPGIYMSLVKTDSSGQSGCNQYIPAFGGNASNFTYTFYYDTIPAGTNTLQMAITLNDSSLVLPDSILCTSTTAYEELTSLPFNMYPNPANELLHVDLHPDETSDYFAEIRDIAGRVMISEILLSEHASIDVSQLPAGVYILVLIDKKNTRHVDRFLKM